MASSDEDFLLEVPNSGKTIRPQIQVTVSRPASIQEEIRNETSKKPTSGVQPRPTGSATTFGSKGERLTATSGRSVRSSGVESVRLKTPHTDRIKGMMNTFINRARRRQMRLQETRTLTPESSIENISSVTGATEVMRQRLESYIGIEKRPDSEYGSEILNYWERWKRSVSERISEIKSAMSPIDPLGSLYFVWLAIISVAFLYNAVVIFMRAAFYSLLHTSRALPLWLASDYFCDTIYIIDIALIRLRLGYLESGIIQEDTKKIRHRYLRSTGFVLDVLSLFPLDLLYLVPALQFESLLRLPRLIKVRFFFTFMDRLESRSSYPNLFRATKTYLFMVYLVHLIACLYYAISFWEGIDTNSWVYNGEGNSYVRCFYWALVTVCAIGANLNPPTNSFEFFFHTFCYLFGLFALSTVIGEIRSAMDHASAKLKAYERRLGDLNDFMQKNDVDPKVQYRVGRWMSYLWDNEQIDEIDAYLDRLPTNMKASIAMHTHLDTLSRVSLFRDCEEVLRQELVLKLRPVWYLPSDYICRKGDVGKEMFILNKGQVQVKIEDDSGKEETVAVLYPGSVFGEISLLSIRDNNRRTAHVVSQWFSQLFVLRKSDVQHVLEDYPGAKDVLMRKAINLLKRDKDRKKPPEEDHQSLVMSLGNAQIAMKAFTQLHDKVRKKDRGKPEEDNSQLTTSANTLTADHLAVPRGKSAGKRQRSTDLTSVARTPPSRPASQASRLSVKPAVRSDSQSSLGSFLSVDQRRLTRTDSTSSAGSLISEAASTVGGDETPTLPRISIVSQETELNKSLGQAGVKLDRKGRTHLRPRTDADYDAMSMVSALLDEQAAPSLSNAIDPPDPSDTGGGLPRIAINPTDYPADGRSASRCIRYDEQEEEEEAENYGRLGVTVDTYGTAHLRPKSRADYETMSAISAMLDVGAFDKR